MLIARIGRRPFEPLRLYVSDGSHYDVRHPEMVTLMRGTVLVATAAEPSPIVTYLDPIHVTRIQVLSATAADASNNPKAS